MHKIRICLPQSACGRASKPSTKTMTTSNISSNRNRPFGISSGSKRRIARQSSIMVRAKQSSLFPTSANNISYGCMSSLMRNSSQITESMKFDWLKVWGPTSKKPSLALSTFTLDLTQIPKSMSLNHPNNFSKDSQSIDNFYGPWSQT